jgi:hypothetical protein
VPDHHSLAADKSGQVACTALVCLCCAHAAVTVSTSLLRRKVGPRAQLFVLTAVRQANQCIASALFAPRPGGGGDMFGQVGKEADHLRAGAVKTAEWIVVP